MVKGLENFGKAKTKTQIKANISSIVGIGNQYGTITQLKATKMTQKYYVSSLFFLLEELEKNIDYGFNKLH